MSKATAKAAAKAVQAPKAPPRPVTPAAQAKAEQLDGPATATYQVGDCPIQHDGVLYLPGHEIPLTAAQAERLGSRVSVIPAAAPGQPTTLE